MIRVYVIEYALSSGQKVYWNESLDFKKASKLCKRLALGGYRPAMIRLSFSPSKLICSASHLERIGPQILQRTV
jgi:hypothetical protein